MVNDTTQTDTTAVKKRRYVPKKRDLKTAGWVTLATTIAQIGIEVLKVVLHH